MCQFKTLSTRGGELWDTVLRRGNNFSLTYLSTSTSNAHFLSRFFCLSSTDVRIFGQFLLSHYVVQFNLRKCDKYKSWPCFCQCCHMSLYFSFTLRLLLSTGIGEAVFWSSIFLLGRDIEFNVLYSLGTIRDQMS